MLRKDKQNEDIEFAPVYFNFSTKTVINFRLDLDKSFQEVLFRIDNCVDKWSCWIVETVDAEYVNISVYSPLPRSTYIKLHCELKNSVKGSINLKKMTINVFFGDTLDIYVH